jgi:serine/threonine protein kinase
MDLDEWVVRSEDIQIGEPIGGGASATVYAAKYRGVDVAAKVFRQLACDSERFRQEANAMMVLYHPNIIHGIGFCMPPRDQPAILVMELTRGEYCASHFE